MKERLVERRDSLKVELAKGQIKLLELEKQAGDLRNTLQRIEGAIKVIDELLASED